MWAVNVASRPLSNASARQSTAPGSWHSTGPAGAGWVVDGGTMMITVVGGTPESGVVGDVGDGSVVRVVAEPGRVAPGLLGSGAPGHGASAPVHAAPEVVESPVMGVPSWDVTGVHRPSFVSSRGGHVPTETPPLRR